jgi:hypothetical protein
MLKNAFAVEVFPCATLWPLWLLAVRRVKDETTEDTGTQGIHRGNLPLESSCERGECTILIFHARAT